MNEQLEKINEQARVLVLEIEKYKSAAKVNEAAAEGLIRVAGGLEGVSKAASDGLKKIEANLNGVTEKIRPLTNLGFLRLQYVAIGISVTNLIILVILLFK